VFCIFSLQFLPTIQAPQSEQVARLSSQNFQCVGRGGTVLSIGYPPQSYAPQLLQSMHHSHERPSQLNQVQVQHVPLGPPTLISQPNVSIASGTSLHQPYVQTPDIGMPGFGGPRALFSYPVRKEDSFIFIFTETRLLVPNSVKKQSATSYEGSRVPPQVTGPSIHSQAQQRASIIHTSAESSIMNPTFEQPKVVTMSFILTTFYTLFLVEY